MRMLPTTVGSRLEHEGEAAMETKHVLAWRDYSWNTDFFGLSNQDLNVMCFIWHT